MYKSILVAVDINDRSDAAKVSGGAQRLATSVDTRMHIVTVFPDSGMPPEWHGMPRSRC